MDASVKKLSLIDWLIHLRDENMLNQIESLHKKSLLNEYEAKLKPFTEKELLNRAKMSEKDIKEGRFSTSNEIKKRVKGW